MQLTIRYETASGTVTHELTLDVLTERLTVRELIRSRVYQEVQDHNLRQRTGGKPEAFQGLVTPAKAERRLNAPDPGKAHAKAPREVDFQKQFDAACRAFDANGFFVLVDDHQAESLDEPITLRHDTKVSFVKLVPLVGG